MSLMKETQDIANQNIQVTKQLDRCQQALQCYRSTRKVQYLAELEKAVHMLYLLINENVGGTL